MRHSYFDDITVRLLDNPRDLDAARALIHSVYCEEMGWSVPKNNPAGQHVATLESGVRGLVDDYDAISTRIGAFHERILIGCIRLSSPRDGKLEVEYYVPLPESVRGHAPLIEISRTAVRRDYRGQSAMVFSMMMLTALEHARDAGASLITTTSREMVQVLVLRCGLPHTGISFKYEDADPAPARVYLAAIEDGTLDRAVKTTQAINAELARRYRRSSIEPNGEL